MLKKKTDRVSALRQSARGARRGSDRTRLGVPPARADTPAATTRRGVVRGVRGGVGHLRALPFFFQAEDGIRDGRVTGVQTCALPILPGATAGARLALVHAILG